MIVNRCSGDLIPFEAAHSGMSDIQSIQANCNSCSILVFMRSVQIKFEFTGKKIPSKVVIEAIVRCIRTQKLFIEHLELLVLAKIATVI